MRVCIIGASGKLGKYMVTQCLERGHEVVGVCREQSVGKLNEFADRITIMPGRTNDRDVIQRAVEGCDGVLTVLVPWGVDDYASGTARAVLDFAKPDARLVFSCGWHITMDGKDVYTGFLFKVLPLIAKVTRFLRLVDIDDQVRATDLIFQSDRKWTVVRGSDLEEGPSEGLPVWSEHVQDEIVSGNKTRRIDFALFMVHALENDELIGKAPAISGCQTPEAIAAGKE